jgi:alkylhydroperoxidase/carboxymuconolactone decarboxylase family protein YurZ
MDKNPVQLFKDEFPELAERFDQLVDAQRQIEGLDQRTQLLINIAIQTANRNPRRVMFHSILAKTEGASRKEALGAVAMNLHLSGSASVLESLPAAVKGFEKK